MKILKCKKCGNVSAFSVDDVALHETILKCPFCGYGDYLLSWQGDIHNFRKGTINAHLLSQIKDAMESVPEGGNASAVFDVLARRFEMSTFSLLALSRILCGKEVEECGPGRFHRFRKLESHTIDGDSLLELIRSQIKDIQLLRVEPVMSKNEDGASAWKEKYDKMKNSYDKLSKDYDMLKDKIIELKKELQSYKDMWN